MRTYFCLFFFANFEEGAFVAFMRQFKQHMNATEEPGSLEVGSYVAYGKP